MTWRPNALIICDDLRVEVNGKQILIGVYAGDIIFPAFPSRINQLIFRIEVRRDTLNEQVNFRVSKAADRTTIIEVASPVPSPDPHENSVFVFGLDHPVFERPESYVVEFGFDGSLEEIGEFKVRTPQSPSESEKFLSGSA
jgi:hypothetical protein